MSILFRSNNQILSSDTIIEGKWNKKKYIVKRPLGSGESGFVYLVESYGKLLALKISLATIDLSYEIRVVQRLHETQGPILGFPIYDIDDFLYMGNLYTYFVMPYQSGVSIDQYLIGKPVKEYISVFTKVIEKLATIHKEGWVFGDLKPEHILIDNLNRINIIDFGGVTPINEGVRQFTEIYDRGSWKVGNRKADPHYDLFSIAMIFIQLSLGKKKLHRIFNQSRSVTDLYGIIRSIHSIGSMLPVIKGILFRLFISSSEVIKQLDGIKLNNIKDKSNNWIEWFLTSSFILFILVSIHFVYQW